MTHPATPATPETKKGPEPKVIFLTGLAVVAVLFLAGEAINAFLSGLGTGLSNFALRSANGASAMDPVFRMFFKLSLAVATFAIPYYCFKAVSLLQKMKTGSTPHAAPAAAPPTAPAAGAAPHTI